MPSRAAIVRLFAGTAMSLPLLCGVTVVFAALVLLRAGRPDTIHPSDPLSDSLLCKSLFVSPFEPFAICRLQPGISPVSLLPSNVFGVNQNTLREVLDTFTLPVRTYQRDGTTRFVLVEGERRLETACVQHGSSEGNRECYWHLEAHELSPDIQFSAELKAILSAAASRGLSRGAIYLEATGGPSDMSSEYLQVTVSNNQIRQIGWHDTARLKGFRPNWER